MNILHPFASKELPDGKKLFRRKHGYCFDCVANQYTECIIVVPYAFAKINHIELLNAPEIIKIDLEVLDTSIGSLTGIPNYVLNKFGYDVFCSKDYYQDVSQYDADVVQNMQIRITVKNPSQAFNLKINTVFHEVKS
jgi:hypothetical protein